MIDISNINKADLLAALYNRARPLGMGFLQFDPAHMTGPEAQKIIDAIHEPDPRSVHRGAKWLTFDYLKGRVMKVRIDGDELDPSMYDRDNGFGAAAEVVNMLRSDTAQGAA